MHYLSLILILQVSIFFGQRTQWIIDLNAGEFERKDVPLFITFPEPIDPNKHYLFVEKEGQTSYPVLVLDEFRVITFVDYLQKQSRVNLKLQEIPAN
jgi:hypothetical protein